MPTRQSPAKTHLPIERPNRRPEECQGCNQRKDDDDADLKPVASTVVMAKIYSGNFTYVKLSVDC